MTKKLSAYNKHVQKEMLKGRSMSQAAASRNKGTSKPRKRSKRKPSHDG